MKHDEIVTGEALPERVSPREACAVELAAATADFIRVSRDTPGPRGGIRHISVFAKCTLAKVRLRQALDAFCDSSGVERL